MIGLDSGIQYIDRDGFEEPGEKAIACQSIDRPSANDQADKQGRDHRTNQECQQDCYEWRQYGHGCGYHGDLFFRDGIAVLCHRETDFAGFGNFNVGGCEAGSRPGHDDFTVQEERGRSIGREACHRYVKADICQEHLGHLDRDIFGGRGRGRDKKWQACDDAREACGRYVIQRLPLFVILSSA